MDVNIMTTPFRNLEQYTIIEAKGDLDSIKQIDTQEKIRNQNVLVNSDLGLFYWNGTSTATPDDLTIIKPNDITLPTPGRWIATWVEHTFFYREDTHLLSPIINEDSLRVWTDTDQKVFYRTENSLNKWDIGIKDISGEFTINCESGLGTANFRIDNLSNVYVGFLADRLQQLYLFNSNKAWSFNVKTSTDSGDFSIKDSTNDRIRIEAGAGHTHIGYVGGGTNLIIDDGKLVVGNETENVSYAVEYKNQFNKWSTYIRSGDGDFIIRDETHSENRVKIGAASGDITFGTGLDVFLPSGDLTIGNNSTDSSYEIFLENSHNKWTTKVNNADGDYIIRDITNSEDRIRIDGSSGNIYIGKEGSGGIDLIVENGNTIVGNNALNIKYAVEYRNLHHAWESYVRIDNGNYILRDISLNKDRMIIEASTGDIYFGEAGNGIDLYVAAGDFYVDTGNVLIGTASSTSTHSLSLLNTNTQWNISIKDTDGDFFIKKNSASVETFRIDSGSNNTHIGHPSFSSNLYVENGDIYIGTPTNTGSRGVIFLNDSGEWESYIRQVNGDYIIRDDSAGHDRFRIKKSTGDVYIGTQTIGTNINIEDGNVLIGNLTLDVDYGTFYKNSVHEWHTFVRNGDGYFVIRDESTGNDRISIDTAGTIHYDADIVIDSGNLEIKDGDLKIGQNALTKTFGAYLTNSHNQWYTYIRQSDGDYIIRDESGGHDRFRIDSSNGNTYIGEIAHGVNLYVEEGDLTIGNSAYTSIPHLYLELLNHKISTELDTNGTYRIYNTNTSKVMIDIAANGRVLIPNESLYIGNNTENVSYKLYLENTNHKWSTYIRSGDGDFIIRDETHSENRVKIGAASGDITFGTGLDVFLPSGDLTIGNNSTDSSYEIFLENSHNKWSTKVNSGSGDYIIRDITNSEDRIRIDAASGDITFGIDLDVFLPSGDLTIGNSSYATIPHLYLERTDHKVSTELDSDGTYRIYNVDDTKTIADFTKNGSLYLHNGSLHVGNNSDNVSYLVEYINLHHSWDTYVRQGDGDFIIRDKTQAKNRIRIDSTSGDTYFGADLSVFLPSGDLTIGNSSYTSIPHLYLERTDHKVSTELGSDGTYRIWNDTDNKVMVDIAANGNVYIPNNSLYIGDSSGTASYALYLENVNGNWMTHINSSNGNYIIRDITNSKDRLSIDSSNGNVKVGYYPNGAANLIVENGNLIIGNVGSGSSYGLEYRNSTHTWESYINYLTGDYAIRGSSGEDRLRINDGTGDTYIGYTTAGTDLYIQNGFLRIGDASLNNSLGLSFVNSNRSWTEYVQQTSGNFIIRDATSGENRIIVDNSKVSIGDNTGTDLLVPAGNITIETGNITVENGNVSIDAGDITVGSASYGGIPHLYLENNAESFAIENDGKVLRLYDVNAANVIVDIVPEGDFIFNPNIFLGWNAFYDSGFKVKYNGNKAGLIKHAPSSNDFEWYISEGSTNNDPLYKIFNIGYDGSSIKSKFNPISSGKSTIFNIDGGSSSYSELQIGTGNTDTKTLSIQAETDYVHFYRRDRTPSTDDIITIDLANETISMKRKKNVLTITTGTYNSLNVANYDILKCDTTAGDITLNGFSGGSETDIITIYKPYINHNVFIHHNSASGTQKFLNPITGRTLEMFDFGQGPIYCDGTYWYPSIVDALYAG